MAKTGPGQGRIEGLRQRLGQLSGYVQVLNPEKSQEEDSVVVTDDSEKQLDSGEVRVRGGAGGRRVGERQEA